METEADFDLEISKSVLDYEVVKELKVKKAAVTATRVDRMND